MAGKNSAMYWTVSEIKTLLEVTLDFKQEKAKQNLDWKTYRSAYEDIWNAFRQIYPVKKAREGELAFRHDGEMITKSCIIVKLRDMQRRYNKAKESNGHGRYMEQLYGICNKIWGEDSSPHAKDGSDGQQEDSADTLSHCDSDYSYWSSSEDDLRDELPRKIRRMEEWIEEAERKNNELIDENYHKMDSIFKLCLEETRRSRDTLKEILMVHKMPSQLKMLVCQIQHLTQKLKEVSEHKTPQNNGPL